MSATIHMTKGLPASGKSTWAEEQVKQNPGRIVRITKDQLRPMLHAGVFSKQTEKVTVTARDALVSAFIKAGLDVIVDDTNFAAVHENRLRALAMQLDAGFSVVDFTHVPLDVCIERNAKRPNPVPEKVIRGMWRQYVAKPATPACDPDLPAAIICDIDGTLAKMSGRGPFDWHRVGEDAPNTPVIEAVRSMRLRGFEVIYMSGRDESCRGITEAWLHEHVSTPGPLYMRAAGDDRKDSIVKRELFEAHVAGKYNVLFVLDDRNQVVDLWRYELGLTCFQVAEGDF